MLPMNNNYLVAYSSRIYYEILNKGFENYDDKKLFDIKRRMYDNLDRLINHNKFTDNKEEKILNKTFFEKLDEYNYEENMANTEYIITMIIYMYYLIEAEELTSFSTRPIAQLVTGKSWVNNHAHVLKSKHNTEFLFYSLVHKDIRKYINGTSRAKLNKSDMLDIVVNIPKSLEEQKKIANVLGSIYLKIEKEQKKLDSLNEYKKGLLQQMFV